MLIINRIKAFFSCLSIYQVKLLWKLFGFFTIVILIFVLQVFDIVETIPTVCAITSIEDSLDEPIPLEVVDNEDGFSIQRSESHFYEEIPDNTPSFTENPSLLPGWPNKEAAKCAGLLIGILRGLAARTYFLVLSPNSGFNCTAYSHTRILISDFLSNFY